MRGFHVLLHFIYFDVKIQFYYYYHDYYYYYYDFIPTLPTRAWSPPLSLSPALLSR